MTMIESEISNRRLPDIFRMNDGTAVTRENWGTRRKEIREILCREEYGFPPEPPKEVRIRTREKTNRNMIADKATGEFFDICFDTPRGEFSFPVSLFLPNHPVSGNRTGAKPPVAIHINFRPAIPDQYFPLEEIIDHGYAAAQIYYQDVTTDDNDFTTGIAAMYPGNDGEREATAWGKLQMWAFAASRLLDYLLTRDDVNHNQIFVIGHSRLGKTAMLAAAMDERFAAGCSNDSGCSGAAITRDKTGERVENITRVFPFWFCPNYQKYKNNEYGMPFDQHFLGALIPPRILSVASAWEDEWADPAREFLTAVTTAQVAEFLRTGTVPAVSDMLNDSMETVDHYPTAGEAVTFADHHVNYHVRPGTHFFSRDDWNKHLAGLSLNFFRNVL